MITDIKLKDIKIEADFKIPDLIDKGDMISWEDLYNMLVDEVNENSMLRERIRDLEYDIDNYYKPIDNYELYGISPEDFI